MSGNRILKKVMGQWCGKERNTMVYGEIMCRIGWVLIYGWNKGGRVSIYATGMKGSGCRARDILLALSIMLMEVGMLAIG